MATKESLVKWHTYLTLMTNKLESPVPEKHKDHPETYKAFLQKEIRDTKAKIEAATLEGVK